MAQVNGGWSDVKWEDWQDADNIRRRLDQGADPEAWGGGRPLHRAAAFGSPEVVAELARRVRDVDALDDGTTALWEAVMGDRPDNARALAAAGADPWRPQLGGWSPGRLSLAGPAPDLFPVPEGGRGLTEAERTMAREGRRLVEALGTFHYEGTGLACVAGIDAQEAMRRLEAKPADGEDLEELLDDPYAYDMDESLQTIGVTTVPGGCVVTQPWGYAPQMPGVMTMLSMRHLLLRPVRQPQKREPGHHRARRGHRRLGPPPGRWTGPRRHVGGGPVLLPLPAQRGGLLLRPCGPAPDRRARRHRATGRVGRTAPA